MREEQPAHRRQRDQIATIFNPGSTPLTLRVPTFDRTTCGLAGSALNVDAGESVRLFDGLIRHRVPWIRESERSELLQTCSGTVLIESITWED